MGKVDYSLLKFAMANTHVDYNKLAGYFYKQLILTCKLLYTVMITKNTPFELFFQSGLGLFWCEYYETHRIRN